jgi:dolichol-phosphate mannosyltransferase
LASAVIEARYLLPLSYVVVIDGDLQHDETQLPIMLTALQAGDYDLVVVSRYVEGGDSAGLLDRWRHILSDGGIRLAQALLPIRLTDPVSGFDVAPLT